MDDSKKVLIIDDEQRILDVFSKQLVDLGHFAVDTAQGGNLGVEKVKSNAYDIVLLDLMMPDKDGLEVLKEINQLPNKPVVMVLTNLLSEEQKKAATDLGVADYIIKTEIDPNTLIAKINQALNGENKD